MEPDGQFLWTGLLERAPGRGDFHAGHHMGLLVQTWARLSPCSLEGTTAK